VIESQIDMHGDTVLVGDDIWVDAHIVGGGVVKGLVTVTDFESGYCVYNQNGNRSKTLSTHVSKRHPNG